MFDEILKFRIVFIALKIAEKHLVQELIIQFSYQQSIISYCARPKIHNQL